MAIKLNNKTGFDNFSLDKKTLLEKKPIKKIQGRPKIFKEPLDVIMRVLLTKSQEKQIKQRMKEKKEAKYTIYIRNLIKEDIKGFK